MEITESSAAVPITVLTGFLGAGKTTLLNRILNGDHGLKVAVLVNDFGAINIDAELVVGVESDVISLANGCICCTIRDDLVEAVLTTISRPERPEYILLEASGVAEPMGIAQTFNNPFLRERVRTDGVICVVDAEQVFSAPETMRLKLFQMACADMIILNKVDLVGPDQLAKVKSWLDDQFHRYRLIEADHVDVPLEVLLGIGRLDPACADILPQTLGKFGCTASDCRDAHHQHHPTQAFSTWTYETNRPLILAALQDAMAKLPAYIYRAKGLIYSTDAPHRRAIMQVVGRRVDITLGGEWDSRRPMTRIVAIGAPDALRAKDLNVVLDKCVAPCTVT